MKKSLWLFAVVTLFAARILRRSYWVVLKRRLALRVAAEADHRQRQGDVHHPSPPDVQPSKRGR